MTDYSAESPRRIFLTQDVLKWNAHSEGSNIHDTSAVARAYEIWSHSSETLKSAKNDFNLVDTVTNLKRAIEQRTRLINFIYKLKTIPHFHKQDTSWDIMTGLNIIRPLMVKNLYAIRNDVEHHDLSPPSINRCMELLDFTWYFLRSTDKICLESLSDLIFEKSSSYNKEVNDYNNFFSIKVDPNAKWQMKFSGWIEQSDFSTDFPTSANILPITVTKLESRDEAIERIGDHGAIKRHKKRAMSEHWMIGTIPQTSQLHNHIVKCYFNPFLTF